MIATIYRIMRRHGPGYNALRRGRYSAPGHDYFLTLTLRRPATGLNDSEMVATIKSECEGLEEANLWNVRIATIMPDHIHFVVTLGGNNSLSSVVRLLKGRLTPGLRKAGFAWQPGYYDHLIRPTDDRLPVFLYIFMNPYRACLIDTGGIWPGFWCRSEDWEWFQGLTKEGCPFPEWLK